MKDLTQGSLFKHVVAMALPVMIGMLLQTLYLVIDLYFVAQLGDAAVAGVSSAGNITFVVMALTQMVGVGAVSLISHAVGRKDRHDANHIFNQSVVLSMVCAGLTLACGYGLGHAYMNAFGADAATREAGLTYLLWYTPGLALQFALVVMGSALRGTGIVKPGMVVQMLTVVLNAILAPILIAGWGTGHAMGVAGAALASSLSIAAGVAMLTLYFLKLEHYVAFDPAHWSPKVATWRRMLNIGLPSGGEFGLLAVFSAVIYWIIRDFGAAAQAGFGIGTRVMQSVFLPAMAIAFSVPPIAGQNFGAGKPHRVRETFRVAAICSSVVMALLTLLCQWQGDTLIRFFTHDDAVVQVGTQFLHVISWNFVAVGLVFTCSSMFQALGNTWPSLISTGARLLVFSLPAIWLSHQPGFTLTQLWYLSVSTTTLQMVLSLWLLRGQMKAKLPTS
jgi:putative MATE family efflux protein